MVAACASYAEGEALKNYCQNHCRRRINVTTP